MNYVISDIHNDYGSFKAILKNIKFNSNDKLYILGDIFDRGGITADPYGLYQHISQLGNMIPILGNHDCWVKDHLRNAMSGKSNMLPYHYNTVSLLCEQMKTEKEFDEFCNWIESFPIQLEIEIDGEKMLLAHAQTTHPDDVTNKDKDYFLMGNNIDFQYLKNGIENYISIFGHISTDHIRYWYGDEQKKPLEIWSNPKNTVFAIDCGNAYRGRSNRLGCMCLETFQCYYI